MKFESSPLSKTYDFHKVEKPFGNFYFCEKFIVAELNAGVHFNWSKIESILFEISNFYTEGISLGYITNRINSYSINPHDWAKVESRMRGFGNMLGSAIVYYNKMMFMNASLEQRFSKAVKIYPTQSLEEAIEWVLSLEKDK
ncbi:hypothetical protein [Algibacter mikhailovii]|uniref:STAS/SEC14 domain-containing protein n=1 Tax=Algibacter mikhailovii TaxID=425498 RepID=A0A918QSE2_9FLAO|nr:hypothetical protein [Algibacter mikhailovii]GGZ70710.1 hypothetical protein GCM10007028_04890 [Algibacter mikhailovii]